MAIKSRITGSPDRYLDLVRMLPLRPIRTEHAHQKAKRMFRSLSSEQSAAAVDYKTVLVSLIQAYERGAGRGFDTTRLTGADIVRHLLAERSMSVNAFAREVGVAQSALSDMLNGKRDWSKSAIIAVADYFGLQPGIFLR